MLDIPGGMMIRKDEDETDRRRRHKSSAINAIFVHGE